ncbi:MAG: hypothetical protein K0S20_640 [Patescibacteria group bacterium]|jgi:hypothetical protein|nr:hypothetical protein [Patescibacteria group bacterium]
MDITEEQIHQKKQELGLEPPHPSHGPGGESGSLAAKMESEADISEIADRAVENNQQFQDPPGTNQRNQYRYGGERP